LKNKKEKDNTNSSNTEKIADAVTTCTFGPMASTGLAGKPVKLKSVKLDGSNLMEKVIKPKIRPEK
jgi:uncharacterized protein (DUF39 family)